MKINIIVATDLNGVISVNGTIPWHLPEDLKRFRDLTENNCVVMGRKTWESLPVKPLPWRVNFVVTSDVDSSSIKAIRAASLKSVIEFCNAWGNKRDLFVIGGQEIYREALSIADKVYWTVVKREIQINADDEVRYFKKYALGDFSGWDIETQESQRCDFLTLNRKK